MVRVTIQCQFYFLLFTFGFDIEKKFHIKSGFIYSFAYCLFFLVFFILFVFLFQFGLNYLSRYADIYNQDSTGGAFKNVKVCNS